jgi:RimJ/RimL family protein N-acetyltransferase
MTNAPSLAALSWRSPTIVTQRLVLRGWEPTDAEAAFRYASDPEVTPYMAWERHETIADTWAFLNDFVASITPAESSTTKSRRVAEKLGMKLDGALRSALEFRGRRWDEAICSLLREDAWPGPNAFAVPESPPRGSAG